MKISKRAQIIETSLSRQLYNMAKTYNDVIDLTLGDPDIMPAEVIRNAACKAVKEGKTRYSANAGLFDLRKAIAKCVSQEYNMEINPDTELIVTVGGMEALYLSLACLIDEGDEVIIPAPYYVNYVQMVRMCGGVPVIVYTDEESGFCVTREQLENAITPKTVAVIINSPCNPTGVVLGGELLNEIAEIAIKENLVVISDEVYRTLIFDGKKHESIITRPGMKARTVVIDSTSKRFAMTGYRVGYAIASPELIENMTKMQENVAACAPLPSQYAGIAAYDFCSHDTRIFEKFKQRREYIVNAIKGIKGMHFEAPEGTFYLFVNISLTGMDCLSFAQKLLEEEHVAVVPGRTYGEAYDGYIRIAYTVEINRLKLAVERISRFMNRYIV
ncbi:MAG: pyridoxal phosphate-dependent aminotransferase [Lachnospiraceae bacterium]|nr:pyridoxal phosphate-dependent aminotransferase [Lachnospiraceae bacterium]